MNYKKLVKDAWMTAWKYKKFALIGLILVIPAIPDFNYRDIGVLFSHIEVPLFLRSSFQSEILDRILISQSIHTSTEISLLSLIYNGTLYFLTIIFTAYCESVLLQTLKMICQKEEPSFGIVQKHGRKSFPAILVVNLGLALVYFGYTILNGFSFLYVLQESSRNWLILIVLIFGLIYFVFSYLAVMGKLFIVYEGQRPLDSLIRAWNELIHPHFWKTVLVFLIAEVGILGVTGVFWVINLPRHAILFFYRNPGYLPTENLGASLYGLLIWSSIVVVSIEYGVRFLISKNVWFCFYEKIIVETESTTKLDNEKK